MFQIYHLHNLHNLHNHLSIFSKLGALGLSMASASSVSFSNCSTAFTLRCHSQAGRSFTLDPMAFFWCFNIGFLSLGNWKQQKIMTSNLSRWSLVTHRVVFLVESWRRGCDHLLQHLPQWWQLFHPKRREEKEAVSTQTMYLSMTLQVLGPKVNDNVAYQFPCFHLFASV